MKIMHKGLLIISMLLLLTTSLSACGRPVDYGIPSIQKMQINLEKNGWSVNTTDDIVIDGTNHLGTTLSATKNSDFFYFYKPKDKNLTQEIAHYCIGHYTNYQSVIQMRDSVLCATNFEAAGVNITKVQKKMVKAF